MPRLSLLAALALSASSACLPAGAPSSPSRLRVGVLPDQDKERLVEQYAPLLEHLTAELGIPCDLVIAEDYARHLDRFAAKEMDLAYFGGATFVHANLEADAIPLVCRDVDRKFTSYVIVPAESPATELAHLEGRSFCFGSPLSTSGHLMPRHFLREMGFEPERHFGLVVFSGSHDETVRMVREGSVEAGVVNSRIFDEMVAQGRVTDCEVRVLWETPTYFDYVWAIQPEIGEDLRARIRDAFLVLSEDDPDHARVLEALRADHFLPAMSHDFEELREIVLHVERASG